jgi:hypothetical protein
VNHRLTDAAAIEQRLLELAYTTDAKLTAPALAYFAPCSVEAAERVLDALASRDQLTMEVEDDGTIVYELRGRQKLADARPQPAALVPAVRPSMVASPSVPMVSPTLAVVLSMFFPGAGHLYAGRVVAAALWFLVVSSGYVLLLPGLVLHLFNMISAAGAATRRNMAASRLLHAAS